MRNFPSSLRALVLTLIASLAFPVLAGPAASNGACEGILAGTIRHFNSETDFSFNLNAGIGYRGFLGSYPERSETTLATAAKQGVNWWGYSFAVRPSLEVARQEDHANQGSIKLGYIISNMNMTYYDEALEKLTAIISTLGEGQDVNNHTFALSPDLSRAADLIGAPELAKDILKTLATYVSAESATAELRNETKEKLEAAKLRLITAYFDKMMSTSDFVYFEDRFDPAGNKLPADQAIVHHIDKSHLSGMTDLSKIIWYTGDTRGHRFHFHGWSFPSHRGVIRFESLFRTTPKGAIANRDIRRALRKLISFVRDEGGRVVFNGNFEEALQMAKNQLRKNSAGEMVKNSRYQTDPGAIPSIMARYRQGDAFSVELRDKNGRLMAGSIMFRLGNLYTGDTVFYLLRGQDPDHPDRNYSDYARAVGLAEILRLHKYGIEIEDVGMVSDFTAQSGGELIPGTEFSRYVEALNAVPQIHVRWDEPFTLDELPFPLADMEKWLPSK